MVAIIGRNEIIAIYIPRTKPRIFRPRPMSSVRGVAEDATDMDKDEAEVFGLGTIQYLF